MTIFNRSTRPNQTKEEHGMITKQGLLAHGVKPNPFVSPASYITHSGIESEEGMKHLERMCQAWTLQQIEAAVDEEVCCFLLLCGGFQANVLDFDHVEANPHMSLCC
jgi:hypothetical protein